MYQSHTEVAMSSVNVLHIASFVGNTGDGAMHDGAYRTRAEDSQRKFSYNRVEMRDFVHWGLRRFDESFLDMANSSDVVLFGGNSIFQMWRGDTASGTYLDFEPDFLRRIKKPIIFYGIGCDATRGINPLAMGRMRLFLDSCQDQENFLFSLRNDGSYDLISDHLGSEYSSRMSVIPDGALFCEPGSVERRHREYVLINLAGDMPEIRFGEGISESAGFCRNLVKRIESILQAWPDMDIVFVPHVYSDLAMISFCLDALDDRLRRTRVEVAPYQVDERAWYRVFALYRNAAAVLAMRFHASLVPIGLGVPTVGLSSHHKVRGMFAGLNHETRCVSLEPGNHEMALDNAFSLLCDVLGGPGRELARKHQLQARAVERGRLLHFHNELNAFLDGAVPWGSQ